VAPLTERALLPIWSSAIPSDPNRCIWTLVQASEGVHQCVGQRVSPSAFQDRPAATLYGRVAANSPACSMNSLAAALFAVL